jgi:molybdenum cofactor biosynthesis protein B
MTASDHPHHEVSSVSFAIVTISSSRTLETDESGDALAERIEADGMTVTAREIVDDDAATIGATVVALADRDDVDAIITSGGTGLSPDDVTVEALVPRFEREIPGFGELFRSLSYEDIGPRALLSRSVAGVVGGVPVFCLPGSKQGAMFGTEELILPTIAHVLGHVQGRS